MQYLTYEEYQELGGVCDLTAFNRNIDRVCGIVNNHTFNRVVRMKEVPRQVKALCRDLIEYFANNNANGATVSSRSQSAGGVSESESYTVKTAEEIETDIDNIICEYLMSVHDDKDITLLYRGCVR